MKVVAFSDCHWQWPYVKIPDGDLLVFAGDFCGRGSAKEVPAFAEWFMEHPHPHKVMIAGNHDWPLQGTRRSRKTLERFPGVHYLIESGCEIDGVSFYGHPYTPEFNDWAFNLPRNGPDLMEKHRKIPAGVDVLITHGAPFGYGDVSSFSMERVGDELLAGELERIKPRFHVYGHMHHGYGEYKIGGSTLLNVSVCDEQYEPVNDPVVFYL